MATLGTALSNAELTAATGGTGRASHTAYAVLCGGTTTTAAQQSIASVGTANQVLTSNGAGALPTFQAAAGGVASTVVFSFATGGGSASANSWGATLNDSITAANEEAMALYWQAVSGTYRTVIASKFIKVASIDTVTVYASIWQEGSVSNENAQCQVNIGGATGSASGTQNQQTPEWVNFTVDVSGLSDGTVYDLLVQISMNAGSGNSAYMDSVIGFGS